MTSAQFTTAIHSKIGALKSEGNNLLKSSLDGGNGISTSVQAQVQELRYRIGSLNNTLGKIGDLASSSTTTYKANPVSSKNFAEFNPTLEDIKTGVFTFNYEQGDIGNFIHEFVIHGHQLSTGRLGLRQYATGDIGVISTPELEVEAYRAQYAYNGFITANVLPIEGSVSGDFNKLLKLTGTPQQRNSNVRFYNHQNITTDLIRRMTLGQRDTELLYNF